jgi:hypothetical protein
MSELDSLDSVKYLYLQELSEPRDNALRIVVQEAALDRANSVGSIHPKLPELNEILKGASPIESTPAYRTFELTWKHYVAYLVAEECLGSCGHYDDEIYSGNVFRV